MASFKTHSICLFHPMQLKSNYLFGLHVDRSWDPHILIHTDACDCCFYYPLYLFDKAEGGPCKRSYPFETRETVWVKSGLDETQQSSSQIEFKAPFVSPSVTRLSSSQTEFKAPFRVASTEGLTEHNLIILVLPANSWDPKRPESIILRVFTSKYETCSPHGQKNTIWEWIQENLSSNSFLSEKINGKRKEHRSITISYSAKDF